MTRCASRLCRLFLCAVLGCCIAMPPAAALAAQQTAPGKTGDQPTHDEMMAEWMKYANPGPQHEILKSLAGNWRTVVKAWMEPGKEPALSQGAVTSSLILGGRFLKEEFKGTFMDQPFEGVGLTGYDNLGKQYVGTWADNLGTLILYMKGSVDASGKVLTMKTTYLDPMSMQNKNMRMVTTVIDANKHTFEMFSDQRGQEAKEMEITYTRQ